MEWKQELDAALAEYDAAVAELQKKRKLFDGLLGFGTHPGEAACHEILDGKVRDLCRRAETEADPTEKRDLMEKLCALPGQWDGPEYARLMLIALQRHTLELIRGMAPEDRKALGERYKKEWPRVKRLPVQDQVLKALQK
ncbi:MAG: hypothetical protein IKE24_11675 [Clostridia bacterium]|nr:hypothetical protein [Clostridia bacterium]